MGKSNKPSDDFIGHLVDETHRYVKTIDQYVQYKSWAEKADVILEKFFVRNHLQFFHLKLLGPFYRVEHEGAFLDFPSNWSLFRVIKEATAHDSSFFALLNHEQDKDHLFEVSKAFFESDSKNLCFLCSKGAAYIVYVDKVEHRDWLMTYAFGHLK
jgi:hypothetical protein